MTRKKKTMDGGFFGISSKITNAKARNTSDADFNQLYQQLTRVDKGFLSRMGNEVKVGDRVLVSKYGGSEVKIDGKEYKIFSSDDLIAIVG